MIIVVRHRVVRQVSLLFDYWHSARADMRCGTILRNLLFLGNGKLATTTLLGINRRLTLASYRTLVSASGIHGVFPAQVSKFSCSFVMERKYSSMSFEKALEKSTSMINPDSITKLKMYALYKQATKGKASGKRPGAMDLVGRAKFDAWAGLGDMSEKEAKKQYIELVSSNLAADAASKGPSSSTVASPNSVEGMEISISAADGVGTIRLNGPDKNAAKTPENETENIFTIPNALCVARIGLAPFIAYLIAHHQYVPAIGLVTVAGITDLLDGWIARVVPGQSSVCGSFLDPMADKILVATLFFSLTYMGLIPVPLTALVVGRDAILIASGFYIRYKSLDPPRTFKRYFNITHPTAQLAPTFISKVNTGLQLSVVGATLMTTVVTSVDLHPYLQILWYCTAATTVISAVSYCFAKDTVKLLRQSSTRVKLKDESRRSG